MAAPAISLVVLACGLITSYPRRRHDLFAQNRVGADTIATHFEALKWRKAQFLIISAEEAKLSSSTEYQILVNSSVPICKELHLEELYVLVYLSSGDKFALAIRDTFLRA